MSRFGLMRFTAVLLAMSLAPPPAAAQNDSNARPNILLLVADDQRPDTVATLGNSSISTPNLDLLAGRGCAFTHAICPYPICTPSRAEILTGCSGFSNGVLDFGGKIDARLTPLGTALASAGYRTCYVGKWHNNGRPSLYGYKETRGLFAGGGGSWWKEQKDHHGREVTGYRGWVFQADDGTKHPEQGVGLTPDISRKFADAAISLIAERPTDPFFLHVNFTAPHDPLLMPPGYEKKYRAEGMPLPANFLPEHPFDHGNLRGRDEQLLPRPRTKKDVQEDLAVYHAVISHLDEQIGRIVTALQETGQSDNTVVVFTSDHGLAMGSHGLRGKQNMYDHTIRVPLIVAGPGIPAGKRTGAMVYLRDLYPTICDLAGVAVPSTVEAESFAPVLSGQSDAIHSHVFGHFRDFQRMVRGERWKLVYYPHLDRYQMFDLQSDPAELRDLADDPEFRQVRAELQERLRSWQQQMDDPVLKTRDG
jgi:arylsulfatase A-like enzyme